MARKTEKITEKTIRRILYNDTHKVLYKASRRRKYAFVRRGSTTPHKALRGLSYFTTAVCQPNPPFCARQRLNNHNGTKRHKKAPLSGRNKKWIVMVTATAAVWPVLLPPSLRCSRLRQKHRGRFPASPPWWRVPF